MRLFRRKNTSFVVRGQVAEFCPGCHGLAAALLMQTRSKRGVRGVGLARGRAVWALTQCQTCGIEQSTRMDKFSAVYPVDRRVDLECLIELTFPMAKQVYVDRLALESALATSPNSIDRETREYLVQEALQGFALAAEREYIERDEAIETGWWARVVESVRVFMFRHRTVPRLIESLRPIQPTPEDLQEALCDLRNDNLYLGHALDVPDLFDAVSKESLQLRR